MNKKITTFSDIPNLQTDPLIERQSSIIESIYSHRKEGVFILSDNFELTYMNDAAIEMVVSLFDVKIDDNKTFLEHVPFERKSRIISFFGEAFKGITSTYDAVIFDTVKQENRCIAATYFPVKEPNSEIIRSAGLELKDITDQKLITISLENKVKNRIRDLAKANTVVLETQRRDIANKLHEDINQSLAAIKMMLATHEMPNEGANDLSKKMRDVLNDVLNDLNRICHDINPDVLEYVPLNTLISDIVARFNEEHHVNIELEDYQYNDETLSSHVGLTLLRVVQDVLYNLVHLSRVKDIQICISTHQSHVDLKIISHSKTAKLDGLTSDPFILSLNARCLQHHGEFKLEKNEDQILCAVSIPLNIDAEQVA